MPQLEDNTFAIKSVSFMGKHFVHQVKWSVDLFLIINKYQGYEPTLIRRTVFIMFWSKLADA